MLVYFPHISKTGGQTLIQGFYKAFGFKKCIKVWNPNFGADVSPDDFKDLGDENFKDVCAIIGHLPLEKFLLNSYSKRQFEEGNVKILTSVRNPIDRIISLYNYISHYDKHPNHESVKNTSPIDFVIAQPANFQYNFLKLDDTTSLDFIFETVEVFPIEKSIEGFSMVFERNFGVKIDSLEIKNSSTKLSKGEPMLSADHISKEIIFSLKEKHQLDFDLYDRAIKDFEQAAF